jgi:CHAT domain-containing protein/predicted DNA-binding protein YlxM (UPF0122 family)
MAATPLEISATLAQAQTTQDKQADKALQLLNLGIQQQQQGRFREALETLQAALAIYRGIGLRPSEGVVFYLIGLTYSKLNQIPQSLESYQQALAIFRAVGKRHQEWREQEARTLIDMAGVYFGISQYSQALEFYQQALVISREIGKLQNEAATLANMGSVYNRMGQYVKALDNYQQALIIARQINNRANEGAILDWIGETYRNMGRYPQALDFYKQALTIHREVGNHQLEADNLNNTGLVYWGSGQYSQAFKFYQQALEIYKQIDNRAGEANTFNNIGIVYTSLRQFTQALEYLDKSLGIYREVSDKEGIGKTLNNIGSVYENLSQPSKALESYQEDLKIRGEIGDKAGKAATLNRIALLSDRLGQYAQALESLELALEINREISDRAGEASTLYGFGLVYRNLGQYSRSLEFLKQSLAINKEIGNRNGEGLTLAGFGGLYWSQGQYTQALNYFNQALAIHKEVGNRAREGLTLTNIGAAHLNQGQYTQALEFLKQGLAVSEAEGDHATEVTALGNLGSLYLRQGQYPQSLQFYQQTLTISKAIGDKQQEGIVLSNIGTVYFEQGQYADASKNLFAAIQVLESLRPRLTDADKVSIFETQADTYKSLQLALVAQNKTNTGLEVAERGRARAFVELLAKRLSNNPNNQLPVPAPTIQEIQKISKEQNATLVQYSIIGDKTLYIWVIKPNSEIAFKQVDLKKSLDTSLQDLVTTSRDDIGVRSRSIFEVTPTNSQPQNPTEKLQQLYKLLIAPIADLLPKDPNERVIFIPQASLFLVPFPALQDEQGKYLIEKHTILTAPAIQVLDLTHKQKHNGQRSAKDVLVVGNPTMPKIKLGELVAKLDPLPGSEKEANQIAKFFNTEALTGSQATKATVMQKMQQARIIHLATHGLLQDFKGFGVPGAIALAPSGTPDDAIDGLLTSSEIFDMKLQADLVVLSACNTGGGTITGDGVVGLSRSLISAGVPSVLVSLWAVNDNSTAFLMTEFYRNLQQNPDKAVALRQAMLTTMKQYPNPKQWAAFTLIGEAN